MQVIIGLGNPGSRYTDTWHNLGYISVDRFAQKHGLLFKAGKGKFYAASGFFNSKKILLVKPTTYMNLSGEAVSEVINYFETGLEDILVIYDDINLPLGTIRMRKSGTAGGHNGIKSIISSLDTLDFARLRIGFKTDQISSILANNPAVLPDLVLAKIPSVLHEDILVSIDKSVDALEYFLDNGIDRAMNTYNEKNLT
ncbi:TPA: aminoacyl-tRNA hydrolase [Candidatus Delongbacteria bacterium]|nr:aminoacyl-tRNA hydrolase [Candidatus Delongbacteria bacterium]